MAVVPASTPAAPVSAKIPQVTGQKKNGKNWHENKAAFRPLAGQTSYAKRAAKQKQEAEVKKMEKEMKEEKEQERQVCFSRDVQSSNFMRDFCHCANYLLTVECRGKSRRSKTSAPQRKRRRDMNCSRPRCTQSVSSVSGAEKRGTRCSSPRAGMRLLVDFFFPI